MLLVAPSAEPLPSAGTSPHLHDGTTARLYVDSTPVGSDTMVAPGATTRRFTSDAISGAAVYGWSGTIDEPRLYNRALSAAEVARSPMPPVRPQPPP